LISICGGNAGLIASRSRGAALPEGVLPMALSSGVGTRFAYA
jgi:hypothetical protein